MCSFCKLLGAEVAQYSAKHLPEVLKDIESYKAGNFKESLVDAFLKLDESLITEEVGVGVIKVIAYLLWQ